MASAGYLASVFVTGTSTAMAAEPMSDISGGAKTTFQITDTAKQIVDPSVAIVVNDVSTGNPYANSFSIDYLTGTVTLSVAAAGDITLDGNFLPRRQIAQAYECSASLGRTLADTSLLGTAHTQRLSALGDVSGSMSCYDTGLEVYTDVDLAQILVDGTTKVLEMKWDTSRHLRFFSMIENADAAASIDGVQTVSFTFQMNSQKALTTGQEVDISIV